MQQRYYDDDSGRFLSVDPVTTNPATGENFNRYWYANNNPYKFTDPDGRNPALLAPIIIGGGLGALIDYGIQKAVNPGKPVNRVEVVIAGLAGAVSGGTAGALVGAVARGTVTVGTAVAVQTGVNAATGAGSVIAQNAVEGKPNTVADVGAGAAGSAAGGLAGSVIGAAAGDFAGPAVKGALQRMSNSSAPGVPNIARTTLSTGNAIPRQTAVQAGMSQAAQSAAQSAVDADQKRREK